MIGLVASDGWLVPSPARMLSGGEIFTGLDATVLDFWRWAFSDLRDNATRGILAEFLVARAVGDARDLRIGWANFDALADDARIEVKCSAFLQGWTTRRLSDLRFGQLRAREFDADRNEYSAEPRVRADVFVFAVQTQQDPASYDMFDIQHWEFWVAAGSTISQHAGKSVGIAWVRTHASGPVPYDRLADTIRSVRQSPQPAPPDRRPAEPAAHAASRLTFEEHLSHATPEVRTVALRLQSLAQQAGLQIDYGQASLILRHAGQALIRLYPRYQSIELVLTPLRLADRNIEARQIISKLKQITTSRITRQEPNIPCRDAVGHWDTITSIVNVLATPTAPAPTIE